MRQNSENRNTEYCRCRRGGSHKLMWAAAKSPLWCLRCERSVSLRRLSLDDGARAGIADWSRQFANIYTLWTESGSYETWAARQLFDLASPLNRHGLALVTELAHSFDCYYWFDLDRSEEDEPAQLEVCPSCGEPLEAAEGTKMPALVCTNCRIVTPMVVPVAHRARLAVAHV